MRSSKTDQPESVEEDEKVSFEFDSSKISDEQVEFLIKHKHPLDRPSPGDAELSADLQLADTMSVSTIESERELDFQVDQCRPDQINLKLIKNVPSLQISEIKGEESVCGLTEQQRKPESILPKLQARRDARLIKQVDELEQIANLETKAISKVLSYLFYSISL